VVSVGTRAAEGSQSRFVQAGASAGKAAKCHVGDVRCRGQRLGDGSNSDTGRAVGGKTIDASGNRRKSHRGNAVFPTELDRAAVAGSEQTILTAAAAIPDRPNRMDDVFGLEAITLGDLGVTDLAAVQHTAFEFEFSAGGAMNSTIDAAATEQRRIRRVNNGVNAQRRDVGNNDFKPRLADPARGAAQAQASALTVTPLSANSACNSPAWNISRMMSQPPTNSPLT